MAIKLRECIFYRKNMCKFWRKMYETTIIKQKLANNKQKNAKNENKYILC